MSKATGVVAVVNERPGKFGPMFSIKLETDETWYGTKSVRPDCKEGDTVEFNWNNNARGYPDADMGSFRVVDAAPATAPAPEAASDEAVPTPGRKAFDKKQTVIAYQSARNSALAFVELALAADIVDLPAKGSKADKWQALRIFVDELTNDFTDDAMKVYETGEWREDI